MKNYNDPFGLRRSLAFCGESELRHGPHFLQACSVGTKGFSVELGRAGCDEFEPENLPYLSGNAAVVPEREEKN